MKPVLSLRTILLSGSILFLQVLLFGSAPLLSQDIRTQELLLDDNASTLTTRNTLTLRAALDDSLSSDYTLLLPNVTGLDAGAMLFVESYTGSVATSRWLSPTPDRVLVSDATGLPVWQTISSIAPNTSEWIDGDTVGLSGLIYANQALTQGTADTVIISDNGQIGVGTTTPDAFLTIRGSNDLFTAYDNTSTLRSSLDDNGEQNWYLGNETGDYGRARVGSISGFPSFELFRPGNIDEFAVMNRSLYTTLGYRADGSDTGSVLAIAQGGNVGVGTGSPSNKLHVTATSDPLRLEGLQQSGQPDSILVVNAQGVVTWASADSLVVRIIDSLSDDGDAWVIQGNAGTNSAVNYVGTSDLQNLSIRANAVEHIELDAATGETNVTNAPALTGAWGSLNSTLDMSGLGLALSGGGVNSNRLLLGAGGSTGTVNLISSTTDIQTAGTFSTIRGIHHDLEFPGGALPSIILDYTGSDVELTNGGALTTLTEFYGYRTEMTGNPVITSGWGMNIGSPKNRTVNFTGVEVDDLGSVTGVSQAFLYDAAGANRPFAVTCAGNVGAGRTTPSQALQVHDGNILVSNTGTAGELRLAEPSAGGINYSAFRSGAQNSDLVYILPDTAGIAGDVLAVRSVTGGVHTLDWAAGGGGGNAWLLTGNGGTNASTNFLGTTDNVALVLRVNNSRAFRIDPRTTSPNLTGGFSGNSISLTTDGNVIAGGGATGATQQIGNGSNYAAISGGRNNQINGTSSYAAIGGGEGNQLSSNSQYTTISGGQSNQVDNGQYTTIAGGRSNRMTSNSNYAAILGGQGQKIDNSQHAVIGGGNSNQINSTGHYAMIGGGNSNQVTNGQYGVIGGGSSNIIGSSSNYSAILGGESNQVSSSHHGAVSGGSGNQVSSSSHYGFIGAGQNNRVSSSASYSSVAGGSGNQVDNSQYSFVGGGNNNRVASSSGYGFMGAGNNNQIDNTQYGFVGGGNNNRLTSQSTYSSIISGNNNQIDNDQYSLIGAGNNNRLTSQSHYSAIVSGDGQQIDNGEYSLIGAGASNLINNNTDYGVIAGGQSNSLNAASYSAISGGVSNAVAGDRSAVAGGANNSVTSSYSSVSGGANNTISGSYSAIAGGAKLRLGANSFGFNGATTASTETNLSGTSSIAYLGNVDLWLGNTDNSARAMKFYEPNTSYSFTGTNYTSLKAQAQAQNIEYIFPDTNGIESDVLVIKSVTGNQAVLDWATVGELNSVGRLIFARKTANETSSSTSLQNDDHLTLALAANKTYEISGALYIKRSNGNGQFDVAWDIPTGATMLISFFANESKSGNSNTGADIRDQDAVGQLNGTGYMAVGINVNWNVVHFKGLVVMGSTAGNITQMWAPSGGGTCTVYTNSYMGAKVAEN